MRVCTFFYINWCVMLYLWPIITLSKLEGLTFAKDVPNTWYMQTCNFSFQLVFVTKRSVFVALKKVWEPVMLYSLLELAFSFWAGVQCKKKIFYLHSQDLCMYSGIISQGRRRVHHFQSVSQWIIWQLLHFLFLRFRFIPHVLFILQDLENIKKSFANKVYGLQKLLSTMLSVVVMSLISSFFSNML